MTLKGKNIMYEMEIGNWVGYKKFFFSYQTPKYVTVHSQCLGLVMRWFVFFYISLISNYSREKKVRHRKNLILLPRSFTLNYQYYILFTRSCQLLILGYVLGYSIYYKGGYQETGRIQSVLLTKVRYLNEILTNLNCLHFPG